MYQVTIILNKIDRWDFYGWTSLIVNLHPSQLEVHSLNFELPQVSKEKRGSNFSKQAVGQHYL